MALKRAPFWPSEREGPAKNMETINMPYEFCQKLAKIDNSGEGGTTVDKGSQPLSFGIRLARPVSRTTLYSTRIATRGERGNKTTTMTPASSLCTYGTKLPSPHSLADGNSFVFFYAPGGQLRMFVRYIPTGSCPVSCFWLPSATA